MTAGEILAAIPRLSALVVGDICLDRWCTWDPAASEPSRETGLPRIGVIHTEVTPGAGGTIANNLVALGAGKVAVLGAIGDDGFGFELERSLRQRGISTDLLAKEPGFQTFTYTKLLNSITGIEDRPRVDFILTQSPAERKILDRLQSAVDSFDVILILDQAEAGAAGVVTPAVRRLLADLAPNYPDKVFLGDSRAHLESFRKLAMKPNQQEAETACRNLFGRVDYPALRAWLQAPLLMVTHGGDGVLVVDDQGETWVRTRRIENPVDICGAGDSFAAAAALALRVTRSPLDAARFGTLAASVTIMKKGTGTASPGEILQV